MKMHTSVAAAAVCLIAGAAASVPANAQSTAAPAQARNVVLVHGAWADGSSWEKVIPILQAAGLHVTAVQNPLTSLAAADAETRRVLALQDGPTVLVGHSFGGTIISDTGNAANVSALVYVAARAPDADEDVAAVNGKFPAAPARSGLVTHDGLATLSEDAFTRYFASDLPHAQAETLFAEQQPTATSTFTARTISAAWHEKPTFYAVAKQDLTISPDLERFFARRMNATTIEVDSVVVGGSYVGLEFAQMYRRFGAEITIVERSDRLIAREDPDVSEEVRAILEREGIIVRTGANCIGFARAGTDIAVSVNCEENDAPVIGSHVLLAVGRRPNTDDLGLETAGITTDDRGYIAVDDHLETNVPGVYALGDCNGRGAFTHAAYNDFEIVAANLLGGEDRRVSQRLTGYALYIDGPLGRVGMTDAEAATSGRRLLRSKRPMTRVGRAVEKGETLGFMKIVADADTQRILGAAILGTGGDEAIHGILDMMNADQPLNALRWAVPIHPTVSELIPTVLLDLKPTD